MEKEEERRRTCSRMRRSALCFMSKRFLWKASRAFSTSAISSGVPRSGSYSHTCRPTWLFVVRNHGFPPSAILSLHIARSDTTTARIATDQATHQIQSQKIKKTTTKDGIAPILCRDAINKSNPLVFETISVCKLFGKKETGEPVENYACEMGTKLIKEENRSKSPPRNETVEEQQGRV